MSYFDLLSNFCQLRCIRTLISFTVFQSWSCILCQGKRKKEEWIHLPILHSAYFAWTLSETRIEKVWNYTKTKFFTRRNGNHASIFMTSSKVLILTENEYCILHKAYITSQSNKIKLACFLFKSYLKEHCLTYIPVLRK